MKVLFIASGFPPFEFSENIINGKLALALLKQGYNLTILTKAEEGQLYSKEWNEPWLPLLPITKVLLSKPNNKYRRFFSILKNILGFRYPVEGILWAELAYKEAMKLMKTEDYNVVITRSPSDIAHLVGLKLKRRTGIKWIANWNDPASGIWPPPYENNLPIWKKIIHKSLAQSVIKQADYNTFPSEFLYLHFNKHFTLEKAKVQIIPHIMLNDLSIAGENSDKVNLRICHSGNLSIERNPENLLIAIKNFNESNDRNIYLDILGIANSSVVECVIKFGLGSFIKFIDPVPYKQALQKMATYDALVILEAQMKESIFLVSKITDYAQLKKPIITLSPKKSEVGRIMNLHNGGLVADNTSVEDIYSKLEILSALKHNNQLANFADKSRLNEYLGEQKVLKLFDDLIKN